MGDDKRSFEPSHELEQPLDRDLHRWVRHTPTLGTIVHSPWVIAFGVTPDEPSPMNGLANQQYRAAVERFHARYEAGDLLGAIFAATRPYRHSVFADLQNEMTDAAYWRSLAHVWVDAENPDETPDGAFANWFSSARPQRANLMHNEEYAAFQALPDRLTIYRGGRPGSEVGLAWTTRRDVAEWFSRRFNRDPRQQQVFERTVDTSFVIAHFTRRDEHEIILHPHYWGQNLA